MTIQHTSPGVAISLSGVTVEPVSGRIGAVISGLDISEPLDDAAVELVQQALHAWKVVFFRSQDLDHASQIAFGRRFGRLTYAHPHDNAPPDGYPEIYTVDDRRISAQFGVDPKKRRVRSRSLTSGWHTDVTPAVNPPAGSVLRADVVPSFGGDTTFTNLVAAYEGLWARFRRLSIRFAPSTVTGPTGRAFPTSRTSTGTALKRTAWSQSIRSCGFTQGRGSVLCSSTPASWTTSWGSRRWKAAGSSSTSSTSCSALNIRSVSAGNRAAWRSGTTGPRPTSPLTTSTTSTASRGCCTGSRSSVRSPLVRTAENQSSLKASRLSRRPSSPRIDLFPAGTKAFSPALTAARVSPSQQEPKAPVEE